MKYFKSDKDWEYNSRIITGENKWLFYGEGYRIASEILEKQILEIDSGDQDFLIYPYCYLLRHYIEIRLKEIIDEGNKVDDIPIDPSKGGHDLAILWKKSQETLRSIWKEEHAEVPKEVSDFINELHSLDVKSDNFRYPINKNGNDTLEKINEINFKKLAEVFQVVKYYLEGVTEGIAVRKEDKNLSKGLNH